VQYELAVNNKDKIMLIWLGKQRAGQREPEAAVQITAQPAVVKYLKEMEKDKEENSAIQE
jgi:hypothetical protein